MTDDDEREAEIRQRCKADPASAEFFSDTFLLRRLDEARAEIARLTEQNHFFQVQYALQQYGDERAAEAIASRSATE